MTLEYVASVDAEGKGVTTTMVANAKHGLDATPAEIQVNRKQLNALHQDDLLNKAQTCNSDLFFYRGGGTGWRSVSAVRVVGAEHGCTRLHPGVPIASTHQIHCNERAVPISPSNQHSLRVEKLLEHEHVSSSGRRV